MRRTCEPPQGEPSHFRAGRRSEVRKQKLYLKKISGRLFGEKVLDMEHQEVR
jgi:hypothetical protein